MCDKTDVEQSEIILQPRLNMLLVNANVPNSRVVLPRKLFGSHRS